MNPKRVLTYIFCLTSLNAFALNEFKTDYCTFFPEGTPSKPDVWKDCCLQHDLAYWTGGSKSKQDLADLELKKCVTKSSSPFFGNLMYRGVRIGHYSPIKNEGYWGNGWGDKERGFKPLSLTEKEVIIEAVKSLSLDPQYIDNYLKLYIKE